MGDHAPLKCLFAPGGELSRRQARWYEDLVEVGVHAMEHVPGRTLVVPDAASRRPDYVQTSARDGLKEAGYVDLSTDQPVTAEEGRRAAETPDLWRDAMDTVAKMAAISASAGVTTRAQRAAAAEQPATGDDPASPLDAEIALSETPPAQSPATAARKQQR
ncbi:hypothetical protein CYMTET_28616 [Cymbomonas tetramitiformis]|uniref:Uncharacterized protein n=1 Tax=Cymbomonas tetramitiformis TaxID=36881 RepID=A0AAE0FMG5_9CHLO|nr:hypothetical protein CYMTET_28616 [Cymbomonas tetramitiformis]